MTGAKTRAPIDPPKEPRDAKPRLLRVVLDTNVVVSGALRRQGSPAAQILDAVAGGAVQLLLDERILAEYSEVLRRPRLRLDAATVQLLLDQVRTGADTISAAPLDITLPDPDDAMFLEVTVSGAADHLVTGNGRHFVPTRGAHDVRIVSPRDYVALL